MNRFPLCPPNPLREFYRIGCGCRQEDQIYILREHYDYFLPYYSSLRVIDVMNFIKDDYKSEKINQNKVDRAESNKYRQPTYPIQYL